MSTSVKAYSEKSALAEAIGFNWKLKSRHEVDCGIIVQIIGDMVGVPCVGDIVGAGGIGERHLHVGFEIGVIFVTNFVSTCGFALNGRNPRPKGKTAVEGESSAVARRNV